MSSATLVVAALGALTTRMWRAPAAAISTLSTPTPARAMSSSLGARLSRRASTLVRLRTMSAHASGRAASRAGAPALASTTRHVPLARRRSTAARSIESAMTTVAGPSDMTDGTATGR